MLAAQLHGPRPIEDAPLKIASIPDPIPRPGELLIRVRACGICHTDLHTVEGDIELPRLPLTPGHQIVGVVEATVDASRYQRGDRVGAAWLHRTCGQCRFCRSGDENLCVRAEFTGVDADGGYFEFATVPADFAHRLPQGYTDSELAPLLSV